MTSQADDAVAITITEPRDVPWLSVLFGYGGMLPFLGAAAAAWIAHGDMRDDFIDLGALWGCAIVMFLAGVRRGLSFRTVGGPTAAQIATMLWLFCAGFASLLLLWLALIWQALALLVVVFASVAALDPIAARHGEAPWFFARLRPVQMLIPVAGLGALIPLAVR